MCGVLAAVVLAGALVLVPGGSRLTGPQNAGTTLPISDRGSELGELHHVVAPKVEWHCAHTRKVETESALAEPAPDNIDESDVGPGELGEQTTRKWRAAGLEDKEPTAGHDQWAIATIRSVDTFAYLARRTLRSLGRGGERKNGNYNFPLAQPVTHSLENLRPLFGVPRLCIHDTGCWSPGLCTTLQGLGAVLGGDER